MSKKDNRCWATEKIKYSEATAKKVAKERRPFTIKGRMNAYKCMHCEAWHITIKMDKEERQIKFLNEHPNYFAIKIKKKRINYPSRLGGTWVKLAETSEV